MSQLTEDRRRQLDELVMRMTSSGAPDDEVSAVVNDFKQKYAAPVPQQPMGSQASKMPLVQATEYLREGAKGALKGAASTAVNLGRLVHQIPGVSSAVDALYGAAGMNVDSAQDFGLKAPQQNLSSLITGEKPKPQASAETRLGLNPTNTAQKVGFVAEQGAEYLAPAGKVAALAKAAPVLRSAKPLVQRMVGEFATGAGVGAAQGQNPIATGVVSGLMPPLVSGAVGVAKGLTKFAFKPTQEALKLNPGLTSDILEQGIKMSDEGIHTAKSLTNEATAYAESLVDKAAQRPGFMANPQGGVFKANRVNTRGEIMPVFTPQVNAAGHENAVQGILSGARGFEKTPSLNTVANMADNVLADNPGELTLREVLNLKRGSGRAAGELWSGQGPEAAVKKQLHGDLFDAANEALERRIGPEWSAANKETQRRLTTQKVVEDAVGKASAESHVPNPYDQFLLMRGAMAGDPVSIAIAMAREAGRVRPLIAAAGRGAHKVRNAPTRAVQVGRGLVADQNEPRKQPSKAQVDSLYEKYQNQP
jgi:hypothetical protein